MLQGDLEQAQRLIPSCVRTHATTPSSQTAGTIMQTTENMSVNEPKCCSTISSGALYATSSGDCAHEYWPSRSFNCTFCTRVFRTAQALGGHMNVHRRERAYANEMVSLPGKAYIGTAFPVSGSAAGLPRVVNHRATQFGDGSLMGYTPSPKPNFLAFYDNFPLNCSREKRRYDALIYMKPPYNISTEAPKSLRLAPMAGDMDFRMTNAKVGQGGEDDSSDLELSKLKSSSSPSLRRLSSTPSTGITSAYCSGSSCSLVMQENLVKTHQRDLVFSDLPALGHCHPHSILVPNLQRMHNVESRNFGNPLSSSSYIAQAVIVQNTGETLDLELRL